MKAGLFADLPYLGAYSLAMRRATISIPELVRLVAPNMPQPPAPAEAWSPLPPAMPLKGTADGGNGAGIGAGASRLEVMAGGDCGERAWL